jgi:hypothetical protein
MPWFLALISAAGLVVALTGAEVGDGGVHGPIGVGGVAAAWVSSPVGWMKL